MPLKLYSSPLSGHAHRVRLFLSLINVPVEVINVNIAQGENQTPEFLELNPFGQVPVLDDNGLILSDSTAILVYLAKKYARSDWLPDDAIGAAQVQRWLSAASGEVAYGLCAARLVTLFDAPLNKDELIPRGHRILSLIDSQLSNRNWIALDHPTIADVALYSYIDVAPEGNIDTTPYTNILAWLKRVEALPGFHALPHSEVGLRSAAS